jgi:hypothetical protein
MIGGFHLSILRAGAGAVALAVSLAPRVSYADSDEEPSFQNRTAQIGAAPTPALVADEVHWYGWQPLIVDGVSTALIGGGTWFVVRAARTDTSARSAISSVHRRSIGSMVGLARDSRVSDYASLLPWQVSASALSSLALPVTTTRSAP